MAPLALRKRVREHVETFGKAYVEYQREIKRLVEALPPDELERVQRAFEKAAYDNIWYAVYRMRGDVLSAIATHRDAERRRQELAAAPTTPDGGA